MTKRRISINIITLLILIYSICNIEYKKEFTIQEEKTEKDILVETSSKEEVIPNNYEGYLEIPKYGIKGLIKQGTSDNILNQNVIGQYKNGTDLEDETGQILLAGHNNEFVFKKLDKVKINDEIIITSRKNKTSYIVTKTIIIKDNDTSYFYLNYEKKELILITCIKDDYHRLLVIAKPK